jgi:hypothetical protein
MLMVEVKAQRILMVAESQLTKITASARDMKLAQKATLRRTKERRDLRNIRLMNKMKFFV